MLCAKQEYVPVRGFELESLPVQEAAAPNPFPQLKKALPEPPGNARMEVTVTASFPHSRCSKCEFPA